MLDTIRHELAGLDRSPEALRRFGRSVGLVFLGIALYLAWRGGWTLGPGAWTTGVAGALLVGVGLAAPRLLRPVYAGWMGLAFALGFVMTRVLLSVVFFGLVTPIGLAMRLAGRDPMQRRPKASYWIARADAPGRETMRKMW